MLNTKIAELRKERGISQERLAGLLNTSRQAVSKWERGEAFPDIEKLKDLATFFGVSIDYILEFDVTSSSVKSFIERLERTIGTNEFSIDVDEIKLMISANPNNFALLTYAALYFLDFCDVNPNEKIADYAIECAQKALLVFQKNNPARITESNLHEIIILAMYMKKDYQAAISYMEGHEIANQDFITADSQYMLGHYEEASKTVSRSFLSSINEIITCQFVQTKALLKQDRIEEARDLIAWVINLIHSIEKKGELYLDGVVAGTFLQIACDRYLGRDYQEALQFVKEKQKLLVNNEVGSENVRFFYAETVSIIRLIKDKKRAIQRELPTLEGSKIYPDILWVYHEVFEGEQSWMK